MAVVPPTFGRKTVGYRFEFPADNDETDSRARARDFVEGQGIYLSIGSVKDSKRPVADGDDSNDVV